MELLKCNWNLKNLEYETFQIFQSNSYISSTKPLTFQVPLFSNTVPSTRMQNASIFRESCTSRVEILAKKELLYDIQNKFLFGDKSNIVANENKKIKGVK